MTRGCKVAYMKLQSMQVHTGRFWQPSMYGVRRRCILAYSDISAQTVLDLAARVLVAGADHLLLAPYDTFLQSTKLVRPALPYRRS